MLYPKTKSLHELLEKATFCIKNGLPFTLYRKPLENKIIGIFQADTDLHLAADFTERGFVFVPFNFEENAVLIKPNEIVFADFESDSKRTCSEVGGSNKGKETHIDLVERGIHEIEKGNLQKVVLSRKIEVVLSKSPEEVFRNLLENYPNALCYLFFHPKVGLWCGATPETLVQIKGRELQTMSLAATLPVENNDLPSWGSKEIDEQQMVSDYIATRLRPKLEDLNVGKAESIRAGDLWHLKSEIKGKLFKNASLKEIIATLHPTPAVCGVPTEIARDFINQNENYQRSFYTGFLGELNLWNNKELSLYVNLRCMRLKERKASIFVGGGITLASQPESEWIETQNKSRTMLNII